MIKYTIEKPKDETLIYLVQLNNGDVDLKANSYTIATLTEEGNLELCNNISGGFGFNLNINNRIRVFHGKYKELL